MNYADRERIEELLQDESRSLRDIAREVGCSDWTVRRIDRQLRGDSRPMKRSYSEHSTRNQEHGGLVSWVIGFGLLAIMGAVLWLSMRGSPPPD